MSGTEWWRRAPLALGLAGALTALPVRAGVAQHRVNSLILENDNYQVARTDRHYTNGIRFSSVTERPPPSGPRRLIMSGMAPWAIGSLRASGSAAQHDRSPLAIAGWTIGQNIYTPANVTKRTPDPSDRPYAAWLYVGLLGGVTASSGRTHHDYELDVGVTGPPALGGPAQRLIHRITSEPMPQGWSHQVNTRLGVLARYELQYALLDNAAQAAPGTRRRWIDLTPRVGYAAGNIVTYVSAGATLRLGFNISDRWPGDARRMLSDRAAAQAGGLLATRPRYAAQDGESGGVVPSTFYVFAAPDMRAVARNIFLRGPAPLASRTLVADVAFGFTAGWRRLRLTYQLVHRTREYVDQPAPDHFGSVDLSWWP